MASGTGSRYGDEDRIAGIKVISGWCIEVRRRRDHVAQKKLAKRVGVGVRWLREIESGNPKSTIDDHLRCASALGLSVGYILFPMLYDEHGRSFPRELLLYDLGALEARCIVATAAVPIELLVRSSPVQ